MRSQRHLTDAVQAVTSGTVIGQSILVIEDEPLVQERVVRALRHSGFFPMVALTRTEILEHVAAGNCAALVLDLGLPADDGINIAKAVRKISDVPILMLTGRAGIHSRVSGLEAGADDYLVKPYASEELIARLRAVLRRSRPPSSARVSIRGVRLGKARLDFATGELVGPKGMSHLTARESRLLIVLCRASGVLSREATYREVFERDWDPGDRSLDVHVANLRRKLEATCGERSAIATIRGKGYELRVPAVIESGDSES